MAAPKFPLKMSDGFQVRTLEELRAHADLYTLEEVFRKKSLQRWLSLREYGEATAVEALDMDAEGVLGRLCAILGISLTEEMRRAYREKKGWAEGKAEKTAQTVSSGTPLQADERTKAILDLLDIIRKPLNNLNELIDMKVTNRIAERINKKRNLVLIETKNYMLFTSTDLKYSEQQVWTGDTGIVIIIEDFLWYKADKLTGTIEKFSIQTSDNNNMLSYYDAARKCCGGSYSIYEDCIIYEQNQHVVILDVEHENIRTFDGWVSPFYGPVFAPEATKDTVAFTSENRLYLAKEKGVSEITVGESGIQGRALSLTNDALLFYCEKTAGLLEDGSSPNGCCCQYDRILGSVSVVVPKSKIQELEGALPWVLYGNELLCINQNGRCEKLWGTLNIVTGKTSLYSRKAHPLAEKSAICPLYNYMCINPTVWKNFYANIVPYSDGVLFTECGEDVKIYFSDYIKKWKTVLLPNNLTLSGSWFRLGRWFYYTVKEGEVCTQWKVSLDDPDNPIQL